MEGSEAKGSASEPSERGAAAAEKTDPRFARAKAVGGGDKGRELLEHVAQGATLDEKEEISALDYLLGAPKPGVYECPVQIDTDQGQAELVFVLQAQDGKVIGKLENLHRNEMTGVLDAVPASCALVATATIELIDANGRKADPRSEGFRTFMEPRNPGEDPSAVVIADAGEALRRRFRYQGGLIVHLANEVRRVSGYDSERVGVAKRRLAKAALD